MRKVVVPLIAVLWGGGIVVHYFVVKGGSAGDGVSRSYAAGANAAVIFGAAMFVVGLYYLLRRPK